MDGYWKQPTACHDTIHNSTTCHLCMNYNRNNMTQYETSRNSTMLHTLTRYNTESKWYDSGWDWTTQNVMSWLKLKWNETNNNKKNHTTHFCQATMQGVISGQPVLPPEPQPPNMKQSTIWNQTTQITHTKHQTTQNTSRSDCILVEQNDTIHKQYKQHETTTTNETAPH